MILLCFPSILLRSLAFGRIIHVLWVERCSSIKPNFENILNLIYQIIDIFCGSIFILICILLIRSYHLIKAWKTMLENDKKIYGKQKKSISPSGQNPNDPQQPELQLQPQQNVEPKPVDSNYSIHDVDIQYVLRFDGEFRLEIIKEFGWTLIGMFHVFIIFCFFK